VVSATSTFSKLRRQGLFTAARGGVPSRSLGRLFPWLGRLTWLLVCLLGLYWLIQAFWGWFLPAAAPQIKHVSQPSLAAEHIVNQEIFKAALTRPSQTQESAKPEISGYQLLGVIASHGEQPGYAILKKNGTQRERVVATGEKISSGITLIEVENERVRLLQNGVEREVHLPEDKEAARMIRSAVGVQ